MSGGTVNIARSAGGSSRSARFRATCARTSIPARSSVRNVALLGRPVAGPVIASISSIVNSPVSQRAENPHHRVDADVIRDESGRIFRGDDPLAEPHVRERADSRDDGGIRVG